ADKLLFASTKPSEHSDVPALVQLIANSLKACGCERSEIQATINSDASDTTRHTVASRLGAALEPYVAECSYTDTAARLGTDGIPLALALSATRRNTTQ
ncbi:MAG: hypothetical protein K2H75_04410, partial [Muribaculaceae bacterium]|nr:hypothetical protein [Muribaculaceae bacterium]